MKLPRPDLTTVLVAILVGCALALRYEVLRERDRNEALAAELATCQIERAELRSTDVLDALTGEPKP